MKLAATIFFLILCSFKLFSQSESKKKVNVWIGEAEEILYQNPYRALMLLDSAKIISKSADLSRNLCTIYDLESTIYRKIGRKSDAKFASYEGLRIAQKLSDSLLIYSFKTTIVGIPTTEEAFLQAKGTLKEVIDFGKRNKEYLLLGNAHTTLGRIYMSRGNYIKAESTFLEALDYFTKIEDKMRMAKIQTNLGIAAFNLDKFKESKKYFMQTLSQSIEDSDIPGMQNDYANLSEYFYNLDNLDSAFFYALKSFDLCQQHDLKLSSVNTLSLLVKIYEDEGDVEKALEYQKELSIVQNEVFKNELELASLEFERLFSTTDSKEKIDYIKGVLQSVEKKNSSLTTLLIVCGVFFVLIILVVYFAYRQQNKLNKALLEQRTAIYQKNEVIDTALKEKEVLLKEIHHRVKNNLQIISSLLNLQSRTITDDKALRALSEGRNRIQAIALLHQKLYQNETFSTVNLSDYLEDLTMNLKHTLTSSDKIITIDIIARNIVLNLDTAVPLGLIISELVTNSLKHAFTEKSKGRIIIEVSKGLNRKFVLEIHDNGKGLPEEFQIPMEGSLGTEIIEALSEQLEGQLTFERNRPGAYFQLIFQEVSVD